MEEHHVGLLVTCLVDMFRPQVGFSTLSLLREAGCRVTVPRAQTCCGQVAYNSGDRPSARAVAAQVIDLFEPFTYVVVPSGSCAGMVSHHYPLLFPEGDPLHQRAVELAAKTFELTTFLTKILKRPPHPARFNHSVTYHDSCSGKRELGVFEAPRQLLADVPGLTLKECRDHESCCGFGGTFCVKYGPISTRMADERLADFAATEAETLLGGDLGCLLHLAGRLSRTGSALEVRHVAEVLAGDADKSAPIGKEERRG